MPEKGPTYQYKLTPENKQALLAGDPDAWNELHAAAIQIARIASNARGVSSEADDIGQDTMLKTWRGLQNYNNKNDKSGRAWLATLANNTAIDHRRRANARPGIPFCDLTNPTTGTLQLPEKPAPSAEAEALASIESDELRNALSQLPAEQREILILSYVIGITHKEIAAMKGIPLGTVKTRIRLGLAKMRVLFPKQ